jgi:hypothetical protein
MLFQNYNHVVQIASSAAILIALFCGPASPRQTGTRSRRGYGNPSALAGVHITLKPASGDEAQISRQDGSFSMVGVPEGCYNLFATRNGYLHLAANAGRIPAPSTLNEKAGRQHFQSAHRNDG